MYMQRIPLESVPLDEEGAAMWLHDLYVKKVKLYSILSQFILNFIHQTNLRNLMMLVYTCCAGQNG